MFTLVVAEQDKGNLLDVNIGEMYTTAIGDLGNWRYGLADLSLV